ncbi:hypothetical protein C2G38_2214722 [Gigaspora rosea]|uniref:Uncharacterized protein n=1 Tax=Gigaspora rosea TaxID=44941 RepID=A0A397UB05_9GLOM|nr:hypothetical protein C2G38_2214722 [Gigaspora rosea]
MNQPLTNLEQQWLCIIIGRRLKFNINKLYIRVLEDPYFIFEVFYYLAITIAAISEDIYYLDINIVENQFIEEVKTLPKYFSEVDHLETSIDKSIFVEDSIVTFNQYTRYRIERLEQFINFLENQENVPISKLRKVQNEYQDQITFLENQIKNLETENHEKEIKLNEEINNKSNKLEYNLNKELIKLNEELDLTKKNLENNKLKINEYHVDNNMSRDLLNRKITNITNALIQMEDKVNNNKNELIKLNDLTKKNLEIHKLKINEYHVEKNMNRTSSENYDFVSVIKKIRDEIDIKNSSLDQKINSMDQKIQANVLETKNMMHDQSTKFKEFYEDLNKKILNNKLEIHKIKNQQKYIVLALIGLYDIFS